MPGILATRDKIFSPARRMRFRASSWRLHILLLLTSTILICGMAFYALYTANRNELLRRLILISVRSSINGRLEIAHAVLTSSGVLTLRGVKVLTLEEQAVATLPEVTLTLDMVKLTAAPNRPLSAIRQVVLHRPVLNIARNSKGVWNFSSLLPVQKEPSNIGIFTGDVLIEDGDIAVRDAIGLLPGKGAMDEHITSFTFHSTMAQADYYPFTVSGKLTSQYLKTFHSSGSVRSDGSQIDCQVKLDALNLAVLHSFLAKSTPITIQQGKANARAQLLLSRNTKTQRWEIMYSLLADLTRVEGTIRLSRHYFPYTVAHGQLKLARDSVELVDMVSTVNGIAGVVNGLVDYAPAEPLLALQITTESADVKALQQIIHGLQGKKYEFTGQVRGSVQISGSSKAMVVDAHITGPSLLLQLNHTVETLREVTGDIHYAGTTLTVANLSGIGMNGRFNGQAWLSFDETDQPSVSQTVVLFTGNARNIQVKELVTLITSGQNTPPAWSRQVSGNVSGSISLSVSKLGEVALLSHLSGPVSYAGLPAQSLSADFRLTSDTRMVCWWRFPSGNSILPRVVPGAR